MKNPIHFGERTITAGILFVLWLAFVVPASAEPPTGDHCGPLAAAVATAQVFDEPPAFAAVPDNRVVAPTALMHAGEIAMTQNVVVLHGEYPRR